MRTVLFDGPGGPEVLRVAEVDAPIAAEAEVVVAVRAVGLNPWDRKVLTGLVASERFPRGLGTDFAGVVESVGAGAAYEDGAPILPGEAVLGWSGRGIALRELLPVPATAVARCPDGLGWELAASLSTVGLTADRCLDVLAVRPGDVVLLSGASGGVGLVFGQLARHRRAAVVGTASPANHDLLRELDMIPVAYGDGVADRVRGAAPGPVTAVQDNTGGGVAELGSALGVPPERICTIVDYAAAERLGIHTPGRYPRSTARLEELARVALEGALRMDVVATYPLDAVADAFAALDRRHPPGKIVVTV